MNARLRFGATLLLVCGLAGQMAASTPSSGTINTPADDTPGVKQVFTYSGGPLFVSTGLDAIVTNTSVDVCTSASPPPTSCDFFKLNVNLPSGYNATHIAQTTVHITWTAQAGLDPSNNDLDLYLLDSAGNVLAVSNSTNPVALGGSGKAEETVSVRNIRPGAYTVITTCSTCTTTVPEYDATVTFELIAPPPAPPQTPVVFQNFVPPLPAPGKRRLGSRSSMEPSIGANLKSGNIMMQATFDTLRVAFDDSTLPTTATWTNVPALITDIITLDAILWTDKRTNRTFVTQLMGGCSLLAYTDDDGASWTQNPLGCGPGAAFDHETIGGGPFKAPLFSTDVVNHYADNVVYCAQAVADAACAISTDGGLVFNPATPAYTLLDCVGLHGHIRVGPEGNLYLPNARCGGHASLVVSKDNGLSWSIHPVLSSTVNPFGGVSDPWVDVGPDGTIYFGYADGDGHARIVVSHDAATTWSTPYDAGASQNVVNTEFSSVAVGDSNRAAFAFLGSQTPGDTQSSTFAGNWYLYVAFTYDGGNTWTTYNATPNDPVQRGCIWNQGGGNPCRNLLDFMGITMDAVGRVIVGYPDGCIDDPLNANNRCVTGGDWTHVALATIARQNGGLGLKAAYDGRIFQVAPGAPTLSGLAGNGVSHLNWTDGSNGNTAITSHRIYRGTTSGGETLLTTVGAVNSYDDLAVANGVTYYYKVTAVNAVGESAQSNEVALTPQFAAAPSAPQKVKAVGSNAKVLVMWSQPASSGTAAISSYKIYRGTAPGLESFLIAVSGDSKSFFDTNVSAGTTYYYKVSAVNSVGEGPQSNEASAQPK